MNLETSDDVRKGLDVRDMLRLGRVERFAKSYAEHEAKATTIQDVSAQRQP